MWVEVVYGFSKNDFVDLEGNKNKNSTNPIKYNWIMYTHEHMK